MSGKTTPTLPPPGQRRGYRDVHVRMAEGGFSIALDAKPLRTPAGTQIVVPQAALAEALAAEWRGQGDKLDLNTVPITRIAATALTGCGRGAPSWWRSCWSMPRPSCSAIARQSPMP